MTLISQLMSTFNFPSPHPVRQVMDAYDRCRPDSVLGEIWIMPGVSWTCSIFAKDKSWTHKLAVYNDGRLHLGSITGNFNLCCNWSTDKINVCQKVMAGLNPQPVAPLTEVKLGLHEQDAINQFRPVFGSFYPRNFQVYKYFNKVLSELLTAGFNPSGAISGTANANGFTLTFRSHLAELKVHIDDKNDIFLYVSVAEPTAATMRPTWNLELTHDTLGRLPSALKLAHEELAYANQCLASHA